MYARLTPILASVLFCASLFVTNEAAAQRRKTAKAQSASTPKEVPDTPSVVMLRAGAAPKVDSSLIAPIPKQKRRRFDVKVVPAAPPGRSRQDIMYSDSLIHRTQAPR